MERSLAALKVARREILDLANRYGASDVRVFGSVSRGAANSRSDFDFLVRYEAGRTLVDHVALVQALSELLRGRVDVVSDRAVPEILRAKVLQEAVPL